VLFQLFAKVDIPHSASVVSPAGLRMSICVPWSVGLRLVFDWRYYLTATSAAQLPERSHGVQSMVIIYRSRNACLAVSLMNRWIVAASFSLAMVLVVVISNVLVQYPINDWLTWGAITYPFAFLIVDLANRYHGPGTARKIVYVGFIVAVLLSAYLATPRIAVASGTAFLTAELLDVTIFDQLRRSRWWLPPLVSSLIGSVVDTAVFFTLAFYGTEVPWFTLALGDFGVKVALALVALMPFRLALALVRPRPDAAG
jgi:uncharacterized PurR-regulated membrane protein YhhQ (DUF165 family)